MNFLTTLHEFLRDLKAQKLRVFLTLFGIIWGTVAIIVLLAFGAGFRKQTLVNMHGLGESISIMWPGKTTKAFEGFGTGRQLSFTEDDIKLLASQVSTIETISAEYIKYNVPVRVGMNITNAPITGMYPVYGGIRSLIPEAGGRFIDDLDMQERRRVAFIGNDISERLFSTEDPVGKTFYVANTPFIVIGVMQKKTQNSSYSYRDKDRVFIPSTTYAAMYGEVHLSNIVYKPFNPAESDIVSKQVREVISKRYKFDPTDDDAVWIWDTAEADKFFFYFFLAFNIFMGLIGSFTLGVAGIGVANIMYIVVQERIREIGIKRAVGAKRSTILIQFLIETFLIIGVGSVIGFGFAIVIIQLLQYMPIKEFVGVPEFSGEVAWITVVILSIVGLAAGLMPARRAANLDVVECLRT